MRPTVLAALPPTPTPLPTLEPAEQVLEPGLRWRECSVSSLDWREGEACLGYSRFALEESGTTAVRMEDGEWMLQVVGEVDNAVYRTRTWEKFGLLSASLYKDGRRVHTFFDRASGFPPHLSLRLVDDRVAWAYSGERVQTIAYDGRDLRAQYHLDAAYAPFELGGKLILIGKKDDASFIVYDGERIGPPFDQIVTAHCCEIGLYAPFAVEGRYGFWGQRDGRFWVVEISPARQAAP